MPSWFIGGEHPEVAPWNSRAGEIKKVSIENGVSSIGDYAFYECSALESIEIPAYLLIRAAAIPCPIRLLRSWWREVMW